MNTACYSVVTYSSQNLVVVDSSYKLQQNMAAIKGSGVNTAASTSAKKKYSQCSSRQQHCLTYTVILYNVENNSVQMFLQNFSGASPFFMKFVFVGKKNVAHIQKLLFNRLHIGE